MRRLLHEEDRDTEPRPLHGDALKGVNRLHGHLWRDPRVPVASGPPVRPQNPICSSRTIGRDSLDGIRLQNDVTVNAVVDTEGLKLAELRQLFIDRHARKEILDSHLGRERWIAVRRFRRVGCIERIDKLRRFREARRCQDDKRNNLEHV